LNRKVPLYERGIQGDLPLIAAEKSPLAPLSQRGVTSCERLVLVRN
jgi:hypothetical protein